VKSRRTYNAAVRELQGCQACRPFLILNRDGYFYLGQTSTRIKLRLLVALAALLIAPGAPANLSPYLTPRRIAAVSSAGVDKGKASDATDQTGTTIPDPDHAKTAESKNFRRIKNLLRGTFTLAEHRRMVFGWPFWLALILTLTLERIVPAEPNRKLFSLSVAHDLIWFVYEPFWHALIIGTYVALLSKIYTSYFSYLTFSGLMATPAWIRFAVTVLLLDLGYWAQHYLNHRVPFLWKLHSVHHSQEQLNFFTDFRYHPLEYVVRHTFITVPFLFLNVTPPVIAGFVIAREWYSRFYHGNIRTNLGPLKHILVTPQSHRVHHSLEARHHDTNFGAIFSIWDLLFGTRYEGFDEYPATGVVDKTFPSEPNVGLGRLLLMPWRQMLHPFFGRPRGDA